jgi:hypothetical protein
MNLEYVKKDAVISGIEPNQVVRVISSERVGDNALTVYYKKSDGSVWRWCINGKNMAIFIKTLIAK